MKVAGVETTWSAPEAFEGFERLDGKLADASAIDSPVDHFHWLVKNQPLIFRLGRLKPPIRSMGRYHYDYFTALGLPIRRHDVSHNRRNREGNEEILVQLGVATIIPAKNLLFASYLDFVGEFEVITPTNTLNTYSFAIDLTKEKNGFRVKIPGKDPRIWQNYPYIDRAHLSLQTQELMNNLLANRIPG